MAPGTTKPQIKNARISLTRRTSADNAKYYQSRASELQVKCFKL